MTAFSEDDIRYARRIVDRLLSGEDRGLEIDDDVSIYDLQKDVADFSTDLELLEYIGEAVPAMRINGEYLVPISLSVIGWPNWTGFSDVPIFKGRFWRHNPYFIDMAYEFFRSLRKSHYSKENIEHLNRDEARSTFSERASEFLATRIAAVRIFRNQEPENTNTSALNILQKAGGTRVSTPGCNFSISTNSQGLRVFWSGAYRISSNYFSHPTTPTTSVLQSGTYVFGVDGGAYGNAIQWDNTAVVSLPGSPSAHLNF